MRERLLTGSCIVLSIVVMLITGFFLLRCGSIVYLNNYEKMTDYSRPLYEEYNKEIENIITKHEVSFNYPIQIIYADDNAKTLILKIGKYDGVINYDDYVIATVENFGTNEQKITIEQSKESIQESYKAAEKYKNEVIIITIIVIIVMIAFLAYLIISSIKKCYLRVFLYLIGVISAVICEIIISLIFEF